MNIEFIKSEFEKLSLIIRTWNAGESVAAIERDIALDKLKNIYDALRFGAAAPAADGEEAPQAAAEESAPAPAVPTENEAEPTAEDRPETADTAAENAPEPDSDEKDVEVEFIFAEEDEAEETQEATENESEETPAEEPEPTEPAPAADEPVIPEPEAEEPDATSTSAAPEQEEPRREDKDTQSSRRTLNSLFSADEIGSRPRTKHHRMMSIYNDAHPREEKVIDISKIFDADEEVRPQPAPAPSPQREYRAESTDENAAAVAKEAPARIEIPVRPAAAPAAEARQADDAAHPVTLGDAINRNAQTLADTLAKPSALAEEITHTKIASLREAIGINDKFLMIRDLFDGDGEAYDAAIDSLDGFDSLDDCMIHIVENYEWNPDSEGAKFLMQLLERKLS